MDRKLEIIQCARELIEERGLAKTSVAAIAERMNVARTLFYHYFPSKEDLVAAVLDTYVDEFIASLKEWNAQRVEGDIEGALDTIVALIRDQLFDNDNAHKPFRRALATHENASLYLRFINRVADASATYIVETTVADFGRLHKVRIDHVYETFYMLILGIVGYMRQHPEASDALYKGAPVELHDGVGLNGIACAYMVGNHVDGCVRQVGRKNHETRFHGARIVACAGDGYVHGAGIDQVAIELHVEIDALAK